MLKKINEVAERSENLENQVFIWTLGQFRRLTCLLVEEQGGWGPRLSGGRYLGFLIE